MADRNSVSSPRPQPILAQLTFASSSKPMATQFSSGNRPNSLHLSISLPPAIPKKTEQLGSKGNVEVPTETEEQSMAAFTILMFSQDPFKIKKVLTQSDVDGSSRLLLPMNLVEEYILRLMDPSEAQLCRTGTGKKFRVLDVDDGTSHHLVLKKWDKNSYFVFTGNWIPNFVMRKTLEAGDQVGLALFNDRFFFKRLKKRELN